MKNIEDPKKRENLNTDLLSDFGHLCTTISAKKEINHDL